MTVLAAEPSGRSRLSAFLTVFAQELRALAPFGVAVSFGATLLVHGLSAWGAGSPAALAQGSPFLWPALLGCLTAVIVAEATGSPRAARIAGLPVRVRDGALLRFVVCGLSVAALVLALSPLAPRAAETAWCSNLRALAAFGATLAAAAAAVATALLGHTVAGALIGALFATWPTLAIAWAREVDVGSNGLELTVIAVEEFVRGTPLAWSLSLALATMTLVWCRTIRTRSQVRRTLPLLALLGIATPGLTRSALTVFSLTHVPLEGSRLMSVVASPDRTSVYIEVFRDHAHWFQRAQIRWWQSWLVDSHTGRAARLATLRPPDTWVWPLSPATSGARPDDWPVMRVESHATPRNKCAFVVRLHNGETTPTLRSSFVTASGGPDGRVFFVDDDGAVLEVERDDGSLRQVVPPGMEPFRDVHSSPCGRFLALTQCRRVAGIGFTPTFAVLDLDANRVLVQRDGTFRGWRAGSAACFVHEPASLEADPWEWRHTLVNLEDGSERPLPFERDAWVQDLDGDRWVVSTAVGEVTVHDADGALLRVLRRADVAEGAR